MQGSNLSSSRYVQKMLIFSAVKSLPAKKVEDIKLTLLFRGFRASSHFSRSTVRSRFSEFNSRRRPMSVLNSKGIAPLGVIYLFHRGSIPLDYPFWQLTLKLTGKSPSEISRSFTAQQTIHHKHNIQEHRSEERGNLEFTNSKRYELYFKHIVLNRMDTILQKVTKFRDKC